MSTIITAGTNAARARVKGLNGRVTPDGLGNGFFQEPFSGHSMTLRIFLTSGRGW